MVIKVGIISGAEQMLSTPAGPYTTTLVRGQVMSDQSIAKFRRNKSARPIDDRFNEKIIVEASGCWRWVGFIDKAGYGRINGGRRGSPILHTHRYAYERKHGPVPVGLELDHLCRNRWCCNPDHLEAVTHRVNAMRGHAPQILLHHSGMCIRGHLVNNENTYFYTRGLKSGRVAMCRICKRLRRNPLGRKVGGLRGGEGGASKLTIENVLKIKTHLANGMTHKAIASLFNVSRSSIGAIANRKSWWHIP